jgi:hypothetical protein
VRRRVLDLPSEGVDDRAFDGLEPVLEEDACERRLEERREDVAVLRQSTELVGLGGGAVLDQPLAEPELVGDEGAGPARDDVRADLRQPALGELGVTFVQVPGDGELEDAVAEELEPLVGRRPIRRPRGVREDLVLPLRRKRADQFGQAPDVACLGVATGASRRSRRPVRLW